MQITQNVTWQQEGETVADLVADSGAQRPFRLHHIVNLYRPTGANGIGSDQEPTVESMRMAKAIHPILGGTGLIVQIAAHGQQDAPFMPADFWPVVLPSRTIRDVAGFEQGPPLPLLFDILKSLAAAEEPRPTHIAFTNADICLQPYFYHFVERTLASGFDSLVINRRTVSASLIGQPLSIASADFGEQHPGLDCFVFPVQFLDRFETNTACVGVGFVMRGLMHNLVAEAKHLLVLTDAHLTFHFGDDRPWSSNAFADYQAHNRRQDQAVYDRLIMDPVRAQRIAEFLVAKPKYRPPNFDPGSP